MTYRTEFPDFDPATMPAIPAHWTDDWNDDWNEALAYMLAERFAAILRDELGPKTFAEIKRRNETDPAYATSCASHDFCDANMVMDAAFRDVLGRGPVMDEEGRDAEEDADIALWNAAWEFARKHWIGHQGGSQ